jgi:hypothetical protein
MYGDTSAWAAPGPTKSKAAAGTAAPGATQTLTFPTKESFGDLIIRVPGKDGKLGDVTNSTRIKAQGKVTIPRNCQLVLTLSYFGAEHLEYIDQFDASQIGDINAAKLELTDEQLVHLKKFKNLFRLNLDNTLVTDKSMPIIGSFRQLNELRLSATDITGSGFNLLDGIPLLTLNLDGMNLKPGNLAKIKSLPKYAAVINCSRTHLTAQDLAFIGKCENLVDLIITGNMQIDDESAKCLANLKRLENINLADTAITDKALPILLKLPSLHKITVRRSTFFKHNGHPNVPPTLHIIDVSEQINIPIEVFEPLH